MSASLYRAQDALAQSPPNISRPLLFSSASSIKYRHQPAYLVLLSMLSAQAIMLKVSPLSHSSLLIEDTWVMPLSLSGYSLSIRMPTDSAVRMEASFVYLQYEYSAGYPVFLNAQSRTALAASRA